MTVCVDEYAREKWHRRYAQNNRAYALPLDHFYPDPMNDGDLYYEWEPRRKMVEGDL